MQQHSPHSTHNNRYSPVRSLANQPVYASLSEDHGLFTRAAQNGENRNFLSSVPRIHKQPGRRVCGRRNNLKWTCKTRSFFSPLVGPRQKGKQRRRETRCCLHLLRHPHTGSCTHIKALGGRLEYELKSARVRARCVAGKQRALMPHLNTCRVPARGLVNGSEQHRYEPHQSSWFVVGSSCCLAFGVIIQRFFSEACYK